MTAMPTPTTAKTAAGTSEAKQEPGAKGASWLLKDNAPRNLVGFVALKHTRFTYHRTWETGLGAEIRVTIANLAFFARASGINIPPVFHAIIIL